MVQGEWVDMNCVTLKFGLWYRLQIQLKSGEEQAALDIPVSKRSDTGKYAVTVSNPFGEDTGTINVVVLGRCIRFPWINETEYNIHRHLIKLLGNF